MSKCPSPSKWIMAVLLPALLFLPALRPAAAEGGSILPDAAMMKRLTQGPMRKFVPASGAATFPEAQFRDGAGGARTLGEWRGRMVLINLWATWCAPCQREMKSLDNHQARLGGADFEVLALNTDARQTEKIKSFYERYKVRHLGVFLDPGRSAYKKLGAVGTPTNILIDCHGRELGRLAGAARWDSDEAVLLIRAMMRQTGCRKS